MNSFQHALIIAMALVSLLVTLFSLTCIFATTVEIIVTDGSPSFNYTYGPSLINDTIKVNTISPYTPGGPINIGGVLVSSATVTGAVILPASTNLTVGSSCSVDVQSGGGITGKSGSITTFASGSNAFFRGTVNFASTSAVSYNTTPAFNSGFTVTSPSGSLWTQNTIVSKDNGISGTPISQTISIASLGSPGKQLDAVLSDSTSSKILWPTTPDFPNGLSVGSGVTIPSITAQMTASVAVTLPCWSFCSLGILYRYLRIGNLVTLQLSSYTLSTTPGSFPQFNLTSAIWTPGDPAKIRFPVSTILPGGGTGQGLLVFSGGLVTMYWVTAINAANGIPTYDSPNGISGIWDTSISYFTT